MADATHCDGPSCANWYLRVDAAEKWYFSIARKYKTKHFCTWDCLAEYVESIDVINGPEDL